MYAAETVVLPVRKKELGTGNAQRRDWRGIITALLVIFVICLLIFLCGYIFTPLNANAQDPSHHLLNLTDFKQYRSSTGAPSWLRDGRLVFDSDQGLNIMTVDGNHSVLIAYKEIHDLLQRGASVQCNADCTHVSLSYAAENPSTNPELASNVVNVLDLKTKTLVRVTRQTKQAENINYMQWSPLGKDYLFAQNGHLFYVAEPGLQPVDISTNSKTTTQIHGMFDWMTEEEIFGTKQAIWWSKDGSKIAFASRDSSDEPAITLTAYRAQEKYQIDTKLVYQKTGEKKLPRYTINIWDKATGSTKSMDVQHRDSSAFHYLFGASWIRYGGQEVLAAVWANRWQNETSLTLCDFNTEMCKLVFEFSYPAKTWAMPEEYRNLVSTEDSIFLILPHLQLSSGNIYQHVVRVFEGSRQVLSLGQFDVRSVIRHDAANGLVYFNTMAPRPTSHHLYVTKDVARNSNVFSCVTCSLPNNCSFAVSTFSDSGKRLSIHCRGPTFHRYYQAEVSSKGQLESVKEVLHDVRMEQLVQKTVLPTIIDDTIQLEGGIEASTRLYLPHSRSHLRALPLLVYVYGGPGWQTIDESFSVGYVDYLVTNLHIAVLKIDARGAGGRGWKYRSPIYGALGHAEMEDQIEVTRLALKKYPYLDPNHIAIHGWSYGGFATLRIVEMAPEKMFKCAISGAPVINFQFYDAAYTERYMGSRPKESYVDVSQDNLAKFKTTQLLLIHGLTDDNVHYQNSAIFIEALQNNGIDFDLMVYPNERHHLTAGPKWLHGYTRMTKFLRECLLK